MNDNLPESERWVPVPAKGDEVVLLPFADFFAESAKNELYAKSAYCSPAFDKARREAEAVIAKAFSPAREHWLKP